MEKEISWISTQVFSQETNRDYKHNIFLFTQHASTQLRDRTQSHFESGSSQKWMDDFF